ncbi:MAG: hypothetical protein RL033_6312 [Pseudomonadota bacterium]|jgi:hypothetical protein
MVSKFTVTHPADGRHAEELLQAARGLLGQRVNLDAVQVLHAEVVRNLGKEALLLLPARYTSSSEAREQQERLEGLLEEHADARGAVGVEAAGLVPARLVPARDALRRFLRRQPRWAPGAAAAALLAVLTLRYAWAVTHNDNWAQQHPEGNWIARYYSGPKFAGNPLLRYDVGVNFDFGTGGPIRKQPKDRFSIRWDTCLLVTREVNVPLTLQADDGAELFVDEASQLAVDPGPGMTSRAVVLKPGVRHLRVDFVERKGTALVRLDGLELEGNDAYTFRRPKVDGLELTCASE